MNAPEPADRCLNCAQPLAARPGMAPRFCAACGQETTVKPPTIGEFVQQFGGAYLSTEGALWRTLALLLFKPGELTARYLAGRRKHYVLPLRLYLTISVVVLLLVRALAGGDAMQIDFGGADAKARTELRNFVVLGLGDKGHGIGVKDGVFYCNSVPGWVCQRVQRRISADPQALQREVGALAERFLGNLGGAMFLLLPSFALWCQIAYWGRGLRYTEHLVFALHVHAFWFGALALTLFDAAWLSGIVALAVPLYTLAAMRRVYGGRRWPRWLRAALISLLYGLVMAVAVSAVGIWSLLF